LTSLAGQVRSTAIGWEGGRFLDGGMGKDWWVSTALSSSTKSLPLARSGRTVDFDVHGLEGREIARVSFDDEMVDAGGIGNLERGDPTQLLGGRCNNEQAALPQPRASHLCLGGIEGRHADRAIDAAGTENGQVSKNLARF